MAVVGVGKSDLASLASDQTSRIQGRQEKAADGGARAENTAPTTQDSEHDTKALTEPFSLVVSASATNETALAEQAKATAKPDEKAEEDSDTSDDDGAVMQSDDKPLPVPEQVTLTPGIVQDPLLLSRWAEFSKGNGAAEVVATLPAKQEGAALLSVQESQGALLSSKQLVASVRSPEAQGADGEAKASGITPDAKDINQQRLQAALLARGSSLTSAMELGRVTRASAEANASSTPVSTQQASTGSSAPTARLEQSLPAALTATLFSAAGDASASSPLTTASLPMNGANPAQGHEWSPVKLTSPQSQWGQQLVDTLKERVEMQSSQNIKQAHIRLDPPDLGKLELTVRIDGDKLSVQLNASNPAVRDALVQSSERLRMNLATQHSGGVEVNVGQGDSQRQQQESQEETILAGRRQLMESESDAAMAEMAGLNALV